MQILPQNPLIGPQGHQLHSGKGWVEPTCKNPAPTPFDHGISGASNTTNDYMLFNFLTGQKSKFCFEVEVPSIMADIRFQAFPISWCRVGFSGSTSFTSQVVYWISYFPDALVFVQTKKLWISTKQILFETLDGENRYDKTHIYIYIIYLICSMGLEYLPPWMA